MHSLHHKWFTAVKIKLAAYVFILFVLGACSSEEEDGLQFEKQNRSVPAFNADSAYQYVEAQVKAGPRNPGSEGHRQTKQYLLKKLRAYAGQRNVFAQRFTHTGYQGDSLAMTNIIAAFNPGSSDRIMLCAHWDTRPRAEKDSLNTEKPILGADDGASGVGILMELARIFSENNPPVGVDIVLFDGEDYGKEGDYANYFVGSRFWSNYPPVKGYSPRFAILLDMVGGQNAQFLKEKNSMQFASALMNELWSIARQMDYGNRFVNQQGAAISDDHVIINRIRGIPIINIINHTKKVNGSVQFAPYWHTQNDNLEIIDRKTLDAVGEVLTELIYNRI